MHHITTRTFSRVSAMLAVVLAGCTSDITSAAVRGSPPHASASRADAAPARTPISGRCETTFTPPPFPMPPVFHQIDVGTCLLSHLGKTSFYGEQDINFAAGSQQGVRTFTAANGDELRVVNVGHNAPSGPGLVSFVAKLTVVGGTGRFAGATGEAQAVGTATLSTHRTTMTLDGWISYDASDRSVK